MCLPPQCFPFSGVGSTWFRFGELVSVGVGSGQPPLAVDAGAFIFILSVHMTVMLACIAQRIRMILFLWHVALVPFLAMHCMLLRIALFSA